MFDKYLPYWMTREMLRAGAVIAGTLFVISYVVDLVPVRSVARIDRIE